MSPAAVEHFKNLLESARYKTSAPIRKADRRSKLMQQSCNSPISRMTLTGSVNVKAAAIVYFMHYV
jgi:hypothetical protein